MEGLKEELKERFNSVSNLSILTPRKCSLPVRLSSSVRLSLSVRLLVHRGMMFVKYLQQSS